MTKPTNCYDIFDANRAARAKHPLDRGAYKLREARRNLDHWQDLINIITERMLSGGKFRTDEALVCCMAYERGSYLKSIPVRLAELIGHQILPGIAALEGDGIPRAEVIRLKHRAETDARQLLADCEAARLRLKGGISQEYAAMRRGKSYLLTLISDASALAKFK